MTKIINTTPKKEKHDINCQILIADIALPALNITANISGPISKTNIANGDQN